MRGYQGSSNLLVRYINQGRLEGSRPHLSPRRPARILLTRPDRLAGGDMVGAGVGYARRPAPLRRSGWGKQLRFRPSAIAGYLIERAQAENTPEAAPISAAQRGVHP